MSKELVRGDAYWGLCPDCRLPMHCCLNVERGHWAVCHICKTRWWLGSNLFSSWQEQTLSQWEANAQLLQSYREVESLDMELIPDLKADAETDIEFNAFFERSGYIEPLANE